MSLQHYSSSHPLQWRHNGLDSVPNHQLHDCLLNRLFRRRSKKTSKLRVTGLCAENSSGIGEFPAQMASNAENVPIWWRHHVKSHLSNIQGPLLLIGITYTDGIDLIHKSQNSPVPYPPILHSEQKCAHFCSEWSIVGYGTGVFWDLWNWSIDYKITLNRFFQFKLLIYFNIQLTTNGSELWYLYCQCYWCSKQKTLPWIMMTSSNVHIFRVTGPLCGEFAGHRWIRLTKASDTELRCFLWINGWVNNGDLRRRHAHYDASVM